MTLLGYDKLMPPTLNNHTTGMNLATFRKLRHKKAWEVAEYLGMKEATYTKYERGESQITIGMVQQVAELLQVNPIRILLADPDHYIESLSQPISESLPETIDKLIELLKQLIVHFSIYSSNDKI